MTDVVFPSRPNPSGVTTPSFPTPDPTPIRPEKSNDLEVVVLRPAIRPPTFDEVVASTASPSRFTDGSASPSGFGFPSADGNSTVIGHGGGGDGDGKHLPSPMPTPGNLGQLNTTLWSTPGGGGGGKNTSNAVTIGGAHQQQHHHHHQPAGTNQSSASTARPVAALNESNFTTNNNNNSSAAAAQSGGGGSPRRKLACWYTDKSKGADAAIPSLLHRTIGDSVKGCLATNDARPLTNKELKTDWKRICALRSGKEIYKLRPPYIDRDEFADPLKNIVGQEGGGDRSERKSGEAMILIPCGYTYKERKDGKWDVVPRGLRPTAVENTVVARKPTEIDPLEDKMILQGSPLKSSKTGTPTFASSTAAGANKGGSTIRGGKLVHVADGQNQQASTGRKVTQNTDVNLDRRLREAAAVPLNRPKANPIIDEADRRLQHNGFGSLATVSRASDEAVSHLLKFCGFSDPERLGILWEIRKAQRAPTRVM